VILFEILVVFLGFHGKMYFNSKYKGPSTEEYIKNMNSLWGKMWKLWVYMNLKKLFNYDNMMALLDKSYENMFLDKWSHFVKTDKKSTRDLFFM
jgi:hypothetical protein